ncbi:hypothetical protein [uncultured Methanofollis sp.]|uniref:hypothetical protein n=1 Tax=uncultured Methanofollis sp. TaxID=262500 RepID=UPI002633C315|nr:hypothetical protein [uncultured Methanofollis sp.]
MSWHGFDSRAWRVVPLVSFGGILVSAIAIVAVGDPILLVTHPFWTVGRVACIVAAFILGAIAYSTERKDLVSLMAPLFAIIIFVIGDFSTGPMMQVLFAATITFLAMRVEK